MKVLFLFASMVVLLAGCASNSDYSYRGSAGTVNSTTDAGYGSGIAPTQQGAGAVGLTYPRGCDTTTAITAPVYTTTQ